MHGESGKSPPEPVSDQQSPKVDKISEGSASPPSLKEEQVKPFTPLRIP